MSIIVTPRHMRAADVCARGSRKWMAENGLDWADFVENGMAVEKLEAFNDAIVNSICAIAREEHLNGRQ